MSVPVTVLSICVKGPYMGFEPGSLRVEPSQVALGEPVKLTIRGGMFYIGALFLLVQAGEEQLGPVNEGATCYISALWTPKKKKKEGVVPVLTYYGDLGKGGPGGELAGFVSVAGPDPGRQPGQTCSASQVCAQASPWQCGCVKGRCACSKP